MDKNAARHGTHRRLSAGRARFHRALNSGETIIAEVPHQDCVSIP
jgi:hypothetical protein